jgi:hypothetical protein
MFSHHLVINLWLLALMFHECCKVDIVNIKI